MSMRILIAPASLFDTRTVVMSGRWGSSPRWSSYLTLFVTKVRGVPLATGAQSSASTSAAPRTRREPGVTLAES
jgi:hypothetical protein